jgi:aspartyl-tRNA(Asn)/glutamyl-tRNA(Gln) amidotransferase subunit C
LAHPEAGMNISEKDVLYVAKLARLSLSGEETKNFTVQLGQILQFINKLDTVNVTGVEPAAGTLSPRNVTRPDEQIREFSVDEITRNAPEKKDGLFVVPKVIE